MEQCFSVLQHANDTLCSYDNTHMQHSPSQNQKKKSAARLQGKKQNNQA